MSVERSKDAEKELVEHTRMFRAGDTIVHVPHLALPAMDGTVLSAVTVHTVMMPVHGPNREEIHSRYLDRAHAEAFVNRNSGYSIVDPRQDIFLSKDGRVARLIGPEVYVQDQDELRKQALAKLTPQERRALGIFDAGI